MLLCVQTEEEEVSVDEGLSLTIPHVSLLITTTSFSENSNLHPELCRRSPTPRRRLWWSFHQDVLDTAGAAGPWRHVQVPRASGVTVYDWQRAAGQRVSRIHCDLTRVRSSGDGRLTWGVGGGT